MIFNKKFEFYRDNNKSFNETAKKKFTISKLGHEFHLTSAELPVYPSITKMFINC